MGKDAKSVTEPSTFEIAGAVLRSSTCEIISDVFAYVATTPSPSPRLLALLVPRLFRWRTVVRVARRGSGGGVEWLTVGEGPMFAPIPIRAALKAAGIPECPRPFLATDGEDYPSFGETLDDGERAALRALPRGALILDEREAGSVPVPHPDFRHVGRCGRFLVYDERRTRV